MATIALTFVVQSILTGMLTGAFGRGLIGDQISIGQAWRIARVASVIGVSLLVLVIVAAPLARGIISGHGSLFIGFTSTGAPTAAALIVGAIGGIIATTCTRPVSAGVSVLLYADLRMRKEGLDLVLQQAGQSPGMSGTEFMNIWQGGPGQATFGAGPNTFGPGGGPGYRPGTGPDGNSSGVPGW